MTRRRNGNGEDGETSMSFKVSSVLHCLNFIERYMPPRNLAELVGVRDYGVTCVRAILNAIRRDEELYAKLKIVLGSDPSEWFSSCLASADGVDVAAVAMKRKVDCVLEFLYSILSIKSTEQSEGFAEQLTTIDNG